MIVERVPVADVLPLRRRVLRPERPEAESHYPQDQDPATLHLALRDGTGAVVCCATLFAEDFEGRAAWRLRGMATDAGSRGQGLGAQVLADGIERLRREGATLLWCNARTLALPFYRRFGFVTHGEQFLVVDVPHYVATLELSADGNGTST